MPECVNLRERYGRDYHISYDPAYDPRGVHRRNLDAWMMTIPCRGNITIYPHGRDLLAVEVDHHPGVAKRLAALGLVVWQDGDKEGTFLFDVSEFEAVAEIVRPRKKRRLTPEQREACKERLKEYAFRPDGPARQSEISTLETAISPESGGTDGA
jgi:hypothetical protein